MEKEKFEDLLNDKSVPKVATFGGGYFKDSNDSVAIQFLFAHAGDTSDFIVPPKKRVWLSAFPLINLIPGITPLTIIDSITIMVNSDMYEYALTYKLSIHPENKKIQFKIEDYPIMAERFLTTDELDGITLYY